jgi:hypothetical protein
VTGEADVAPRCVVLVEGPSDAAALHVLGRRLGLVHPAVRVVPMGGVTNVGHHLAASGPRGTGACAVAGVCDGAEVRIVVRALRRHGHDVATRADLEVLGFFVCDDDLEDELIRAVGVDAVVEVVARQGEIGLLRTFQRQPAQRERPLHDQLHRFAGTTSGRKTRFAAALAEEVPLHRAPAPLRGVLEVAHAVAAGGAPVRGLTR